MNDAVLKPSELPYDVDAYRADFPILSETVHGKPLVYLDNGASAQKPKAVIDAMRNAFEHCYANVHRGAYDFSERTTAAYEGARETVRAFLNAKSEREIVFAKNTTEAINLVAYSFGRGLLKAGDAVVISEMEHHSNIVPWQMLRDEKGIELRFAPISDEGELLMDKFAELLDETVKLVAITHVSNVLGTITPAEKIVDMAHAVGAKVLFDGSQSVMHMPIDVQALDCDFYVFTGHKIYGPTGIGVLYGKEAVLETMPPFLGGGDMISSVTLQKSTWAELPAKFEAGTPPIVEAIGLGAAIDYISGIGLERIAAHERDLLSYAMQRLAAV
ncbi:MAG: aminotransferase class V-fold PLP-dependent enzyme, partial [Alphaproteobacteria bacterium]|nr:aminotransferase class V-fold PLP-dependent enzyme [Alphaproteobacteria bacterium]